MTPQYYITIGQRRFTSFHFFGLMGVLLGITITVILSRIIEIPFPEYLVGLAFTLAGALAAYAIQYIATGSRELVVYRYFILLVIWDCFAVWLFPFTNKLAILDLVAIGFGMFQWLGRIGCFHGGCCHGKPWHHGVHYSELHVKKGFPSSYAGTKIFPVQLVYSATILTLTISCIALTLSNAPAGTSFANYIVMYGFCRFILEFMRGDAIRNYLINISEAQWLGMVTSILVCIAGIINILPIYPIHFIITSLMIAVSIMIILTPSNSTLGNKIKPLLSGQHLELLYCVEKLKERNTDLISNRSVETLKTSEGFMISMASVEKETFFTISSNRKKMRERDIIQITKVIQSAYHPMKKKFNVLKRTRHIVQMSIE